jgi:hypothetical protein
VTPLLFGVGAPRVKSRLLLSVSPPVRKADWVLLSVAVGAVS